MYLCSSAPNASKFINLTNLAGETALDAAVNQHRHSGRGTGYERTVRYLLQTGAHTEFPDEAGTIAAAASKLADDVPHDVAVVLQAERREAEVLERRKRERMNDPHYQVMHCRYHLPLWCSL